jgi:hypothetical protein
MRIKLVERQLFNQGYSLLKIHTDEREQYDALIHSYGQTGSLKIRTEASKQKM